MDDKIPEVKNPSITIPETGFVRLAQVLAVFPIGKSCWWEGVKSGRYPQSVKISERCTGWAAEDIHALIKQIKEQQQKKAPPSSK